jgi:hypothetical protein
MIALKHNLTVLRRSAARAEAFQFLSNPSQIIVLFVYAIHYRGWFPELTGFKAYTDPQLLFLDLTTST